MGQPHPGRQLRVPSANRAFLLREEAFQRELGEEEGGCRGGVGYRGGGGEVHDEARKDSAIMV